MTRKYSEEEWKKIIQTTNTMPVVDVARAWDVSRNEIHRRIREQKKKSFWNKLKELFDGVLWKLP